MKTLVIGAGPSFADNIEYIKSFDGVRICVDVKNKQLIDMGIIPDYITTFEKLEGLMLHCFDDYLTPLRNQLTVVYNYNSAPSMKSKLGRLKLDTIEFKTQFREFTNNVGLFSVRFAYEVLKSKEIYLAGMDHDGTDYPVKTYENWTDNFHKFMEYKSEDCRIINKTGKGRLYFEGIES